MNSDFRTFVSASGLTYLGGSKAPFIWINALPLLLLDRNPRFLLLEKFD